MYFVYILTNRWHTVLYTGMTDSLPGRLRQHRDKVFRGFTQKYNCDQLVFIEEFATASQAAAREKEIKGWKRVRKDALIAAINPEWNDLSAQFLNG